MKKNYVLHSALEEWGEAAMLHTERNFYFKCHTQKPTHKRKVLVLLEKWTEMQKFRIVSPHNHWTTIFACLVEDFPAARSEKSKSRNKIHPRNEPIVDVFPARFFPFRAAKCSSVGDRELSFKITLRCAHEPEGSWFQWLLPALGKNERNSKWLQERRTSDEGNFEEKKLQKSTDTGSLSFSSPSSNFRVSNSKNGFDVELRLADFHWSRSRRYVPSSRWHRNIVEKAKTCS